MNTPGKILTVLVLYEMQLDVSPAYRSLSRALERAQEKGQLFIYDNSLVAQLLPHSNDWSIYYYHDPSNPGVSRAYNAAAVHARQLQLEWLLFADQDTSFPENIYERYLQSVDAFRDCHVFAPSLIDEKGVVSPFQPGIASGTRMKKIIPGKKSLNEIQVINSGLLIDLETFESAGGYDERLRLDFSDFIFLKRLKRCIQDIIIINAECSHELSSSRKGTLSHALNRFEIYLKGTKVMRHKESAFVFVYTAFLRAIKLSIRYRSGKFIGSFLSNEL